MEVSGEHPHAAGQGDAVGDPTGKRAVPLPGVRSASGPSAPPASPDRSNRRGRRLGDTTQGRTWGPQQDAEKSRRRRPPTKRFGSSLHPTTWTPSTVPSGGQMTGRESGRARPDRCMLRAPRRDQEMGGPEPECSAGWRRTAPWTFRTGPHRRSGAEEGPNASVPPSAAIERRRAPAPQRRARQRGQRARPGRLDLRTHPQTPG